MDMPKTVNQSTVFDLYSKPTWFCFSILFVLFIRMNWVIFYFFPHLKIFLRVLTLFATLLQALAELICCPPSLLYGDKIVKPACASTKIPFLASVILAFFFWILSSCFAGEKQNLDKSWHENKIFHQCVNLTMHTSVAVDNAVIYCVWTCSGKNWKLLNLMS